MRRLLYALHTAAQRTDAFDSTAATGSTPRPSGTVSVAEAAALMGCSPRHVRALITDGRLSAKRVGARVWAVDADALDHYQHHNTAGGTTP
ncbi:helix-turn-helix domain-containing protein [Streptomyces echinoruber]|uniref:Helix-turn-helix domain-containing protein n=1 Tax=Streptomyces echinoruber TaxID=68898 RepID=A0A918S448_9ACTN|nr:helix-turn-helix domain-containing protein [Streptomyces echinoruber]GHA19688.1 hypothetical protein GCM10010389_66480 [Streptomyces echinoruber]